MHIKWAWMRLSTTLRNDALQTDVNKWRAAKKIRPTHQYELKPKSRRSRALHVMAFDLEFMIVDWAGLNQADKQKDKLGKANNGARQASNNAPRSNSEYFGLLATRAACSLRILIAVRC